MKLTILAVASLALAAGCGTSTPQTANVVMDTNMCDVQPVNLAPGQVDFAVRNLSNQAVKFAITENGDEAVDSVTVQPMATVHMTEPLHGGDVYHITCGDVVGPDIKPGT